MENSRTKKPANKSMYAMLGLLSFGAMTGYELRKLSEQSIQHFWRESFGQIYPSLRELEVQGLVTRKSEIGAAPGRPARQVYALTAVGREALQAWVAIPAKPEVPRCELLLKIFFGRAVSAEANLRQVAQQRQRSVEELAELRDTEERIQAEHRNHPDMPYWLLTLNYGKRNAEAEIAWCDEAAEILKGLASAEIERVHPTDLSGGYIYA